MSPIERAMMVVADASLMAEAPELSLYRQPSLVVETGKVTAALRRNLLVWVGKGGGCVAESLADIVFGLLGCAGNVANAGGEAGVGGTLLCGEEVCPGLAFGVWQSSPDEVVDLVGDDGDEVWGVSQKVCVENDFAASEKTRREDFVARAGARFKLAPMCPELLLERDG
jgi:hypothetical protein